MTKQLSKKSMPFLARPLVQRLTSEERVAILKQRYQPSVFRLNLLGQLFGKKTSFKLEES